MGPSARCTGRSPPCSSWLGSRCLSRRGPACRDGHRGGAGVAGTVNAAVVNALANAAVRKRLADLGLEIFPREQQTPEALAAFQKAEIEKWWPILKEAGIKM